MCHIMKVKYVFSLSIASIVFKAVGHYTAQDIGN